MSFLRRNWLYLVMLVWVACLAWCVYYDSGTIDYLTKRNVELRRSWEGCDAARTALFKHVERLQEERDAWREQFNQAQRIIEDGEIALRAVTESLKVCDSARKVLEDLVDGLRGGR
jgi:cell division protein FtsB